MEGHGKGRHSDVLLKHYKLEKTLGIGLSCKVKSAEHILTGNKVAIKILNRGKIKKLDLEEKVQREIRIMRLFMHPHIIRLYEVIQTQTHIYVVMERVNSGELFDYIVQKGRLPDDEARHFFQQIISGVEYCHGNKVVHRDLKPENLLLDSNLNIKIIDFGLCNEMRDGHFLKTNCGSPNYAAPEVISSKLYVGPEIDVWSCGVILYALLCGTLPFDDANIPNLYKKIKSGMYAVPGHLSAGARDLIQRILTVDPMKRVTIPQIRQHPWFQVQLPRYLAMPPPDTVQQVRKVHEGILQEVINLGFERNQLIESLLNRTQDQATVSYYSLLDHKLCASNGYLEDGGFSRMHFYESATSAFACPLQGAPSDQGSSHRPNFPDENKWTLGLQSTACPHEIMKEVVRALTELRVCWRSIGHYNLRCKWQPGLHGNSESYSTNPVHFDDRISNGFGSVENNVVPENLFNAVKFELQIYKTMDEKFLLDVRRVDGPHLVFLSLCASLLHQLRVH